MKKVVVFLVWMCYSVCLYGSGCYMHYTINQGLSNNTIQTIIQDKEGFIWIGTKDGLNRFDGYTMQVFCISNIEQIRESTSSSDFVRCMLEQPDSSQIWIGTETGVYVFDKQSGEFSPFPLVVNGSAVQATVSSIVEDHSQNIWMAVSGVGIFKYEKLTHRIEYYRRALPGEETSNTILTNHSWSLCVDDNDVVWASTFRGGLCYYLQNENRFVFQPIDTIKPIKIYSTLYDSHEKCIWLGTLTNGLYRYDINKRKGEKVKMDHSIQEIDLIHNLLKISSHELWIGSKSGLLCYNLETLACDIVEKEESELSMQAITSLLRDREGGIWLGSEYGGVYYMQPQNSALAHYYLPNPKNPTVQGRAISGFSVRKDGSIWVGSHDCGVSLFNPKNGRMEPLKNVPLKDANCLLDDGNSLWIGGINGGLVKMDYQRGNRILKYTSIREDSSTLSHNTIFAIIQTRDHQIYIGSQYGMDVYIPDKECFNRIPWARDIQINDILEDALGRLWVATEKGLFCYRVKNDKYTQYQHTERKNSLPNNFVTCLYEDCLGNIWAGTYGGGLCKLDENTQSFEIYDQAGGMPTDIIHDVTEDQWGNIWVGTNKALVQITSAKKIRCYDHYSGMQGNQFTSLYFDSKNDMLYGGGVEGFNVIYPNLLYYNKIAPSVMVSNIYLGNRKIENEEELMKNNVLTIDESVNSIGFDLTAASYVAPLHNQYAYYMENFDKKWLYTKGETHISYNLPIGHYVLHVKAANNDGLWSEKELCLPIRVFPPFWKSIPMSIFYVVTILGFLCWKLWRIRKNRQRKHNLEQMQYEMKKEKELYNSKIKFFINIAHDIRIPLCLIQAPLEIAFKNTDNQSLLRENLETIRRNSDRLKALADQIVDFNKIGQDEFYFNFEMSDMVYCVTQVCQSFEQSLALKQISLKIDIPQDPIRCYFDKEAITKMIYNLLSNSMKYAKDAIWLKLSQKDSLIRLEIANNGEPITTEFYEKIFQPFYQIKENEVNQHEGGSGVGLTIVKHVVEKHNGRIEVQSEPGQTSFVVELPLIEREDERKSVAEMPMLKVDKKQKDLPTLLVVEDEEELLQFIVRNLVEKYAVFMARNGNEAVRVLDDQKVDLILTDVMMDGMDGLELCRYVRSKAILCHIPVIMLTARTDLSTKIEGVERGADLYLEKPFSMELLQTHIAAVLHNRKLIKQLFSESIFMPPQSSASNMDDMKFLEDLNKRIEKQIDKSEGLIELLSEQMSMSRSNLHKKIKTLSGSTPNDYIQLIRLKKAAELLTTTNYKINEISYMTGFNTPSYFAKCFYRKFGVLPKDFVRTNQGI